MNNDTDNNTNTIIYSTINNYRNRFMLKEILIGKLSVSYSCIFFHYEQKNFFFGIFDLSTFKKNYVSKFYFIHRSYKSVSCPLER